MATVADARATQAVNYVCVASLAFLAYDVCLTLPAEISHIWSKPNTSFTKWVFIVLRWYTLVLVFAITLVSTGPAGTAVTRLHRPPYCGPWYSFQAGSLQLVTALMESIMMLRVYALYNRSRRIGLLLLGLFVLEETAMATSLGLFLPALRFSDACIAHSIPHVSVVFGAAPIAFEALMLGLTWRRVLALARPALGRQRLLVVLLRDGTWTFLAVFLTLALNGLFYLVIAGPMNSMMWTWQFVVSAAAGCRLVLHMHTDGRAAGGRERASSSTRVGTSEHASGRAPPGPYGELGFALTTFDAAGLSGGGTDETATALGPYSAWPDEEPSAYLAYSAGGPNSLST